jgi:hypothetical protein
MITGFIVFCENCQEKQGMTCYVNMVWMVTVQMMIMGAVIKKS